jgi:hypothetical protein
MCWAQDGGCAARDDEDCRKSRDCPEYGACFRLGDICGAGAEADCQTSVWCRKRGGCHLYRHGCAPASDADCQGTAVCRGDGHCHYQDHDCHATTLEPQMSCTGVELNDSKGHSCCATTLEDCRQSELCVREGKCRPERGDCVE